MGTWLARVEGEMKESTCLPVSELRWELHGEEGSGDENRQGGSLKSSLGVTEAQQAQPVALEPS